MWFKKSADMKPQELLPGRRWTYNNMALMNNISFTYIMDKSHTDIVMNPKTIWFNSMTES